MQINALARALLGTDETDEVLRYRECCITAVMPVRNYADLFKYRIYDALTINESHRPQK